MLDLRGMGRSRVTYDPDDGEAGTVDFLDADGNITGTLTFENIEEVIEETVACFTPGVMIMTPQGEVAVEEIVVGDQVMTLDHGAQTVRWIGARQLQAADLAARPGFNPVRITAGALAAGLPEQDLLVSPQHRMLLSGAHAEMLFGEPEVLAAALYLVNERGVRREYPQAVTYIHLMFDRHEIIRANGAWTESFQPGDLTLSGMGVAQRDELLALFPEVEMIGEAFAAARPSLRAFEAEILRGMAESADQF